MTSAARARTGRLVALACGALLVVAAGWWLLRNEPAAPPGAPADVSAALHGPDASGTTEARIPRFAAEAPAPAATPIALDEAARGTGAAPAAQGATSLRGRVVTGAGEGGSAPVPGALVEGFLATAKHPHRKLKLVCDAAGRFEIPLAAHELALKSGELIVTHPRGLGLRRLAPGAEDVARGGDLGDIELLLARAVPILVLDDGSRPVPGAVAVTNDVMEQRSERTDARGRALLPAVLLDTPTIGVWAHRFFGASAELPPADVVLDEEHPLVVVLQRCPSLDVVVTDASGAPQPELLAVLGAQQALFADLTTDLLPGRMRPFAPAAMLAEVGASHLGETRWTCNWQDGAPTVSGSLSFDLDAGGRASISDLLPGVPFDLSVKDSTGALAWGPLTLTLQPGEVREVQAVLAHAPVDFVVHVADAEGAPLPGAYVEVVWDGKDRGSAPSTDARGLVTLHRVHADMLTLVVDKPDYVTRRLQDVAVARGGRPLEVVLEPGVQVHVLVRDAYGRPVQAQMVSAMLGDQRVGQSVLDESDTAAGTAAAGSSGEAVAGLRGARASAKTSGSVLAPPPPADTSRWLLTDLPPGALVLQGLVGGRTFSQAHDSRVSQAELVVPGVGALRVSFAFALDESLPHVLEVRPADAASGAAQSPLLSPHECSIGEALVPTVLPGDYSLVVFRWELGTKVACSRTTTVHVAEGATVTAALTAP
ncbi:MAG TPA: carboxypeptidase-like regulatory domain-containing protein [Planctomycetota bacterium]|nr:carboxypeptidase-like regulatory domain-containing protein [Planctomycetota bacterium]